MLEGNTEGSYKKKKAAKDDSSDEDMIAPKKGLGVPPVGNKSRG